MKKRIPRDPRIQQIWEVLREQKLGDIVDRFKEYADNVRDGADPIEAMHGHLCGPKCWHWEFLDEKQKEKLLRAPWNRPKKKGRR